MCSGLYGILLVVICATLLTAEIATHHIPLHYFEVGTLLLRHTDIVVLDYNFLSPLQGFFTYLYIVAILFLLYVFCFLLHETACCGSGPPAPGTVGRNTYFHVSNAVLMRLVVVIILGYPLSAVLSLLLHAML